MAIVHSYFDKFPKDRSFSVTSVIWPLLGQYHSRKEVPVEGISDIEGELWAVVLSHQC